MSTVTITNSGPKKILILFVDPAYNTERHRIVLEVGADAHVQVDAEQYYLIQEEEEVR